MDRTSTEDMSLGARWKLAWRVFMDGAYARRLVTAEAANRELKDSAPAVAVTPPVPAPAAAPAPVAPVATALPPERLHASALTLLAALQREGRLVDFLQQEVTGFSDADVAAAARVVHAGCRRVLQQGLDLEPAVREPEGSSMSVPAGFDAQRIRLTGNVAGQPPFRGTLRHPGWVVRGIRFPAVSEALDPRVLAAAEVELS
jgi:hypothetical protein